MECWDEKILKVNISRLSPGVDLTFIPKLNFDFPVPADLNELSSLQLAALVSGAHPSELDPFKLLEARELWSKRRATALQAGAKPTAQYRIRSIFRLLRSSLFRRRNGGLACQQLRPASKQAQEESRKQLEPKTREAFTTEKEEPELPSVPLAASLNVSRAASAFPPPNVAPPPQSLGALSRQACPNSPERHLDFLTYVLKLFGVNLTAQQMVADFPSPPALDLQPYLNRLPSWRFLPALSLAGVTFNLSSSSLLSQSPDQLDVLEHIYTSHGYRHNPVVLSQFHRHLMTTSTPRLAAFKAYILELGEVRKAMRLLEEVWAKVWDRIEKVDIRSGMDNKLALAKRTMEECVAVPAERERVLALFPPHFWYSAPIPRVVGVSVFSKPSLPSSFLPSLILPSSPFDQASMLALAVALSLFQLLPSFATAQSPSLASNGVRFSVVKQTYLNTCKSIADSLPTPSDVSYLLNPDYMAGAKHYMTSSDQMPACVVSPRSAEDVSVAIKIIGQTRTPYAVKSGGHASNQGFSSTTGILISLQKLTRNVLSADNSSVTIGAGQVWDDVYAFIEDAGVNVIGGRVSGVGVGGFVSWGGGYSWKTNQYGLTTDSVQQFELVLPSGEIRNVTAADADLFFSLKGGGNNFGIITRMTLATHTQSKTVFAGDRFYLASSTDAVVNATQRFSAENKDPKAQIITTLNAVAGVPVPTILFFYDGPSPPAGTFSMFDGIPLLSDAVKEQSFLSFVKSTPSDATAGQRGAFHSVSLLAYSPGVMAAISSEFKHYAASALLTSGTVIGYDIEPFSTGLYDKSQGGAFPHSSSRPLIPLNIYFAWLDPAQDSFWKGEMKKTADIITRAAIADGQDLSNTILYPNYALADTPLEQLYGAENLARLRRIKAKIDPQNVTALTGGFKI